MKSTLVILCLSLSALLFLCSYNTSDPHTATLSSDPLQGRDAPRRVLHAYFTTEVKTQNPKERDEDIHGSKHHEGYGKAEYLTSESGDELIYNIDYHGVTTHPNPSPKHPAQKKAKTPPSP